MIRPHLSDGVPGHRRFLLVAVLAFSLAGCAGLLPALQAASAGAGLLGTLIDVAEGGADAYHRRHPSQESEVAVAEAVLLSRRSLAALEAALAAGEAADQKDAQKARQEALRAYGELRSLLDRLGVLSGTPPPGGAEVEGVPEPGPLELPTEGELERLVGAP